MGSLPSVSLPGLALVEVRCQVVYPFGVRQSTTAEATQQRLLRTNRYHLNAFAEALAQYVARMADAVDQAKAFRLPRRPECTGEQVRRIRFRRELAAAAIPDLLDKDGVQVF